MYASLRGVFSAGDMEFYIRTTVYKRSGRRIDGSVAAGVCGRIDLLGGEPFEPEHQYVLLSLLQRVRREFPQKQYGLTVAMYTKNYPGKKLEPEEHAVK